MWVLLRSNVRPLIQSTIKKNKHLYIQFVGSYWTGKQNNHKHATWACEACKHLRREKSLYVSIKLRPQDFRIAAIFPTHDAWAEDPGHQWKSTDLLQWPPRVQRDHPGNVRHLAWGTTPSKLFIIVTHSTINSSNFIQLPHDILFSTLHGMWLVKSKGIHSTYGILDIHHPEPCPHHTRRTPRTAVTMRRPWPWKRRPDVLVSYWFFS